MKVAVLTNTIAPYRLPLYSKLAARFELAIRHGGLEANREEWNDLECSAPFDIKRSWGVQIRVSKKRSGKSIDTRFLHITPGLFVDLFHFRPDAIISNEMGFRSLVALTYGALFRIPVWIWWGGTCHTERNIGAVRRVTRLLFQRWVEHWISYGETSTEYLLSIGVRRNRILQIQNCVDEDLFLGEGPRRFDLHQRPVILYVGRLVLGKGISHLLHAAARLQREGFAFSVLLVGSGPEERRLRTLADELRLRNVYFEHAVTPNEIPAVYRSGDVLVFPTLEDVWGLVVNEAILSGLPVLCSKYAGCATELLPPEAIFDPLDEHDFVSRLRQALKGGTNPPDRSRVLTTAAVADRLIAGISECAS